MMPAESSTQHEDLFYEELIRSYVEAPRFIGRPWLVKQIEEALTAPSCRFLLLTTAPGAGKTAFMAWLAHQHSTWPRYFIRRDQRTPLGDVGAQSLLLQIGFQVAASHPALFERQHLQVVIEQRIGEVSRSGEAIAADIDKLFSSPFYQMVVQIRQQVERNSGKVTGIHIGEWITDPRLIPLSTLQHMALLDPARVMLKESPDKLLVILIDALDELRYRDPEQTLLSWLATCPELPTNVRFVLTSRPDEALLARLRGAQHPWLKEMAIEDTDPNIQQELRTYALKLTQESEVKAALEVEGQKVDDFANVAARWARGNIGVLDAVGRAIDQVLLQPDRQAALHQLLDLKQLPNTLEGLFAFFLHQIREMMTRGDKSIAVKDENGKVHYLSPWPTVYLPILGVLTVAREPLTTLQIQNLGAISAGWGDLCEAMDALRQFLNRRDESYSLYHATLIEFLTNQKTQQNPETRDLYLDEREWHRNITSYYRGIAAETGWDHAENYGLSYVVQHLNLAYEWQQIFALLDDPAFGRAKLRFDPSTRSYAHDLDLGRQATVWEGWTFEESITLLPRLWQYTLLRCSLASRADQYPEPAFRLLVLLGRKQEAIALAELLTKPAYKVHIYIQIAEELQRQANQESDWYELIMRAVEVAQLIEDRTSKAEALCDLGRAHMQTQQREQARRLWTEAEQVIGTIESSDRSKALRDLGIAYAQAQQWDQAQQVIRKIGDSYWQAEALSALGKAYAQEQLWAEAERVIRMIGNGYWQQVEALSALGKAYAQAQQWNQARLVWGVAERIIWTIEESSIWARACCYLGEAYAQAQQWDQAQQVWEDAEMTIERRDEQARALSDLGEMYMEVQQWEQAERVINTIEDTSRRAGALATLGKALTQARPWEQAQKVWAEAEQVIHAIEESKQRSGLLSDLVEAYTEVGQWEQAHRVIDTMEESNTKWRVFEMWLEAYIRKRVEEWAQAHQWEQIEEWIHKMENSLQRAFSLKELGKAYAQAQQWERAERVWTEAEGLIRSIENKYWRANALCELGEVLAQAQQGQWAEQLWAEAEQVIHTIEESKQRSRLLGDLVEAYTRVEQWEQAERISGTMEDDYWQTRALKALAEAYIRSHLWEQAERTVSTMEDDYWRSRLLSDLAEAYAQAQLWEQAERLISTMEALADDSSLVSRAEALQKLVKAYAQAQLWEQAERITSTVEDSYERFGALKGLGEAYAEAQLWEQAEQINGEIESDSYRANLMKAYAQASMWEQAERTVSTMEDSYERAKVLGELGKAYAEAQLWEQAERVWTEAEGIIYGERDRERQKTKKHNEEAAAGRYWRAKALGKLGEAYAQAQQWDQAQRVWEDAERVIMTIERRDEQARALSDLGEMYMEVQQWEQAERVIDTIEYRSELATAGRRERAQALSALGIAYARAQQWDQAQRVWEDAERVISMVEDKVYVEGLGSSDNIAQPLSDLEIARALALGGELAEQALQMMEASPARGEALRALGIAYAQGQQWDQAERVISTIEDSSAARCEALKDLGKVYAQKQLWADAERVIGMIGDNDWQAEALSALGIAYAQAQQRDQAQRVIRKIGDSHWKAEALSVLGIAYAQAQQWDRAQRMWMRAERVSHKIENDYWQPKALSVLGIAYARAQQWEQAERVIGTIEDSGAQVEALSDLGRVYAQMQQWKRAQQVWKEAERVIHRIKDDYQQAKALSALGIAYAQAQQWEQAERVIGMIGNSYWQAEPLSDLGIAYAQAQQWEQAERVIDTIENSFPQSRALRDLATEMAKAGQHERLLKLIQRSWLRAKTRQEALRLFSPATEFISSKLDIGTAFFEAFSWVSDFLVRRGYDCSFCGKNQEDVEHLIAGPGGVYICNECVARIAGESDEVRGATAERCFFCSKTPSQTKYIKRGPGQVSICNECIALCQEIFEEIRKRG